MELHWNSNWNWNIGIEGEIGKRKDDYNVQCLC